MVHQIHTCSRAMQFVFFGHVNLQILHYGIYMYSHMLEGRGYTCERREEINNVAAMPISGDL